MTHDIHPSALVDARAELAAGVRVGPYCVIGAGVLLEEGVELSSHVVIEGATRVGAHTRVHPFAVLGCAPQDLKYRDEPTELCIGENNLIREHVTMHRGTAAGGGVTLVGDGCVFMVGAHVAHDCRVGNGAILANSATLGGHVEVGDNAVIGGMSAIHQFVRIGRGAMVGGMSGVDADVPPHCVVAGERASLRGLNLVGLRRRGIARPELQALRDAYRGLFDAASGAPLAERVALLSQSADSDLVSDLLGFVAAGGRRALCRPAP